MKSLSAAVLAITLTTVFEAHASESFVNLKESCAACHAVSREMVSAPGLDHIWSRKAPDLFYAGKKFRREWLVTWLQNPKPIRPSGVFFEHFSKTGEDGADFIPANVLPAHPALSQKAAEKAADALMKLNDDANAVRSESYKGGAGANIRFGKLAFTKLRGCSGCHQYADGKGGLSGPELFTAGDRLKPDFIASYIIDPHALDPGVWMPRLELSDQDIQRITAYLLSLHGEEKK